MLGKRILLPLLSAFFVMSAGNQPSQARGPDLCERKYTLCLRNFAGLTAELAKKKAEMSRLGVSFREHDGEKYESEIARLESELGQLQCHPCPISPASP